MSNPYAAGNDPERITETVPASSSNNQTGQEGYAVGWAPHPPRNRAPHSNPSRPSRSGSLVPRASRVQPGSLRQRRGSRRQAPHGLHALRLGGAPLRRPKPSHFASQASRRHDPPALLLRPRPHLPARPLGFDAAAPPARRPHRLQEIIELHQIPILITSINSVSIRALVTSKFSN